MPNLYEKIYQQFIKDIENKKRKSPLRAIRIFCTECMGFSASEVKDCMGDTAEPKCPLFAFRFGRNMTGKNPSKKK